MKKSGKPVWMYPARAANFPDYLTEKNRSTRSGGRSAGPTKPQRRWPGSSSRASMDKYPNLKIITHHLAASCRCWKAASASGWDQLGARTSDEDLSVILKRLKKRPLDYFKHFIQAYTAMFGGVPATHGGLAFYDLDKIVFASDCPFDPEKGTMYTRETLRIIARDMPRR